MRSPRLRLVFALSVVSLAAATALIASCDGCKSEGRPDQESTTNEGPTKRHGLTEEQAEESLVKIGSTTIVTVGDLADRLADQSPYLRTRYESPERRIEFLETMVRFELLAHEALQRGLDEEPEVQRVQKQLMIQALMKTEFEDQIQLSDITDAEIQAYYEGHPEEFHKAEQVRAAHILIKNRATAERAFAELSANPTDANLFRETAGRLNEDPITRDEFGDLSFIYRDGHRDPGDPELPDGATVPAAVAEAAFAIQSIGGLAPTLIETDQGFHIVKLTARRPALDRTLAESERAIRNRLWREKRETAISEFVDRLRREANIEEHWDVLSEVHVDTSSAPPEAPPPPTIAPHELIPGTSVPRMQPALPTKRAPGPPTAPPTPPPATP